MVGAGRAGCVLGGGGPRQPASPRDPTPGTRDESLLSSPWRLRGPGLGRERRKERRGDWGNFPASLSGSINHRSRGGGRAGKCAEPERSVVAPDTSLSPHRFLSFGVFFFFSLSLFSTSPSPSSLGWRPQPSSLVAAPPLLGAAARPRIRRRLAAPGRREGKARRLAGRSPTVSAAAARPAPPGAGTAAPPGARRAAGAVPAPRSRGPLGRPFPLPSAASPAMVAARAPAL